MMFAKARSILLAAFLLSPAGAMAQTDAQTPAPQLSNAQLDQLVAPIALYPDPLLSEVLMAATYPLQVVEAERWLQANKNLQGDALKAALDQQSWDESIKALVATPSVLDMMSSKLDWTQKLGDAIISQQAQVMDAVQRLRTKAQANNKLQSTPQQTVTTTPQASGGPPAIVIEPTDPDMLYVPYYDPGVVYGDWPYPDYPPYYWPAPGYIAAGIIATGIAFGAGYGLARWARGGYRWGGGVNWGNRNLAVNRPINGVGNQWRPSAAQRQNVGNRGGRQNLNFRGSNGQNVLGNRGGNRGGTNVGGGNRGNANLGGNRGGNRGGNVGGNRGNRGNAGVSHRASRGAGGGNRAMARHVGGGGGVHRGGGGGMRSMGGMRGGGGGGFRGGGGGGRGGGGRGGGRRSDIMLKHDIALLGHLDNGLGYYRFSYVGSHKAYVGVIAQEVQQVAPQAVTRGRDGYLRVNYEAIGVPFDSYQHWLKTGARIPSAAGAQR